VPRELTDAVAALLLPPGLPLILVAIGAFLTWRRRVRAGVTLGTAGFALLWLSCLSIVGQSLVRLLEPLPVAPAALEGRQAIVVLGAGRLHDAPEYGEDVVGTEALARVRYGARVARQTGLPVLVAGGKPYGGSLSEAATMSHALEQDLATPVRWIEGESNTTAENATRSFAMLQPEGRTRIILVTSAAHMRRAELAFRKAGFDVVAAPTVFVSRRDMHAVDWLPSATGLRATRTALGELLGIIWYRLRGVA
jgi:uncharacterized SAM-binding protein YcdF (DUF218 family)